MNEATEIINGKRHWKRTSSVEEMLDRYRLGMRDCRSFFVDVFKVELGLREGGFTSYVGVYQSSFTDSLVVGGKVSIFHFPDYNWVVKHGAYEKVVEDMRDIFELIREAWAFYE